MPLILLILFLLGCGQPGTGHAPEVTATEIAEWVNNDLESVMDMAEEMELIKLRDYYNAVSVQDTVRQIRRETK